MDPVASTSNLKGIVFCVAWQVFSIIVLILIILNVKLMFSE